LLLNIIIVFTIINDIYIAQVLKSQHS